MTPSVYLSIIILLRVVARYIDFRFCQGYV